MNKFYQNQEWKSFWVFFKYCLSIISLIILENLVINSFNFVDNFMVSRLANKDTALPALLIVNTILILPALFLIGITVLCDVFFAQYLGNKNKEKIEGVIKIKFWFSFLFANLFLIFLYLYSEEIVTLFNKKAAIITTAKNYLQVILPSFLLFAFSHVIISNLRMIKKLKIPLLISTIALVVNIFLDWLFIYSFNWGVVGSAWATLLVRFLEFLLLLFFLKLHWDKIGINLKTLFVLDRILIKKVFSRIFILAAFITSGLGVIMKVSLFTNFKDPAVTSAIAIGFVISSIIFAIFPVISLNLKIFIGPELGANNMKKAKKTAHWLIFVNSFVIFILVVITLLSAFIIPQWTGLSNKAQLNARNMIVIYALTLPIMGWSAYVTGLLKVGGYTVPEVLRSSWHLLINFPLAYLLIEFSHLSFINIHLIIQLTWIIPFIISIFLYRSKIWLRKII